mmetsp:Transcript_38157/g.119790  ORF Transcript_38157/g.119790 Transcript_38157/m.119790 type:complete len:555 (-) Transcript_38157:4-1668(-)
MRTAAVGFLLAAPALGFSPALPRRPALRSRDSAPLRAAPAPVEVFDNAAASFFPFPAEEAPNVLSSTDMLVSMADQTDNIAGPLFAGALFPYLAFLGFMAYKGKGQQTPPLANFGFQFLLAFVIGTIPSAIVAKKTYGVSLADADWLHGSAEALLTVTNLLIIAGLRDALLGEPLEAEPKNAGAFKAAAAAYGVAAFAGFFALSGAVDFLPKLEAHTALFGGIGNLPADMVSSFGLAHPEPINALSIPTWAIHFSSVIEYVVAMRMVWAMAYVTGNPAWKGLTWGMLPLHASGLVACTYHFFYNDPELAFMVPLQAGLTFLGDCTIAYAAYRIAANNGWAVGDLNPFKRDDGEEEEEEEAFGYDVGADGTLAVADTEDEFAYQPGNIAVSAAQLIAATVAGSYAVKYGSLAIDLPYSHSAPAALALVFGPPIALAYGMYKNSPDLQAGGDGEEGEVIDMNAIKKYGVAGTLSYVLTELAFWALAIPAASFSFMKTAGHFPDFTDNTDRVTVLGFVFAASNVARAALPLRLGAAFAVAPWVDENIVKRFMQKEES